MTIYKHQDVTGTNISGIGWYTVPVSKYTGTPASTSVLTMSDTSDFFVGAGVQYVDARGTFRAFVTALTTDTNITIAGAAFNTSNALTALSSGRTQVIEYDMNCGPNFNVAAEANILRDVAENPKVWELENAYLVTYRITQGGVDRLLNQK